MRLKVSGYDGSFFRPGDCKSDGGGGGERAVVGEGGGGWEGRVLLRFCCSISFG